MRSYNERLALTSGNKTRTAIRSRVEGGLVDVRPGRLRSSVVHNGRGGQGGGLLRGLEVLPVGGIVKRDDANHDGVDGAGKVRVERGDTEGKGAVVNPHVEEGVVVGRPPGPDLSQDINLTAVLLLKVNMPGALGIRVLVLSRKDSDVVESLGERELILGVAHKGVVEGTISRRRHTIRVGDGVLAGQTVVGQPKEMRKGLTQVTELRAELSPLHKQQGEDDQDGPATDPPKVSVPHQAVLLGHILRATNVDGVEDVRPLNGPAKGAVRAWHGGDGGEGGGPGLEAV